MRPFAPTPCPPRRYNPPPLPTLFAPFSPSQARQAQFSFAASHTTPQPRPDSSNGAYNCQRINALPASQKGAHTVSKWKPLRSIGTSISELKDFLTSAFLESICRVVVVVRWAGMGRVFFLLADIGAQSGSEFHQINNPQGYTAAGRNQSDCEGYSASVAPQNDMIASQSQYQHLGSTSNLETSEAEYDPAPPQQVLIPVTSSAKTGPDVTTPRFDDPRTLVPDQVCTCAACLHSYRCPLHLWGPDVHPDCQSWVFRCRHAGCKWDTKWDTKHFFIRPYWSKLVKLYDHEKQRSHHGKPGNYECSEIDCKYTTKRWRDLLRHASSKHCINPKSFECPVLTCKYHQQGFSRKDKRTSHYQKVHGGISHTSKPNQAIMPKAGGCS